MTTDSGNSRGMVTFRNSILLLVAALAAWAYLSAGSQLDWECTPIDASRDVLPDQPCFRATLSDENLVTLEWQVINAPNGIYLGDDIAPYNDVGFRSAACPQQAGGRCRHSFRVRVGGQYRWVLGTKLPGEKGPPALYARASLEVPALFPPAVMVDDAFVDALSPSGRRITWSPDSRNFEEGKGRNPEAAWIEVRPRMKIIWQSKRYPRFGQDAYFDVAGEKLSAPGIHGFSLRECYLPMGSTQDFCSPWAETFFTTGGDYFLGTNVLHAEAGKDLDLTFTARSGDVRRLTFSSMGKKAGTVFADAPGNHALVPGSLLVPGKHRVRLDSCVLLPLRCAAETERIFAEHDGFVLHRRDRYFHEGTIIAVLFQLDGSPATLITSPARGLVRFSKTKQFWKVEAGQTIAKVSAGFADEVHILVDQPIEWELGRHYTQDFAEALVHPIIGAGQTGSVTFDQEGGIWALNEYSNSIEHISPDGSIETIDVPIARSRHTGSGIVGPVRPFAVGFDGNLVRRSASTLNEFVLRVGQHIWFPQGGGFIDDYADIPNHSRLAMIDPEQQDLPGTPFDDRLCVFNFPTDDPQGFGNNQIIGIAASGERIWVAESRGLFQQRPSVLSTFLPDPDKCEGLLDFENPEGLSRQTLQYCNNFTNPEQDGCIRRFPIEPYAKNLKLAHLVSDPEDGSIWFTDVYGGYLGNINVDRDEVIRLFAIPDDHSGAGELSPLTSHFGGFPWSIAIDAEAVYFVEFATNHILRFDKRLEEFDEIHVPGTSHLAKLHSIAVDQQAGRLWFTMPHDVPLPLDPDPSSESTIGYVDLESWRRQIANPDSSSPIRGVLYSGFGPLMPDEMQQETRYAFAGIAVDPNSGRIALATAWRRQVTELRPHSGFWP